MAMMFDNSKSSEMPEIGRLGELTVYQYLLKEMDNNPNVTFVNWCNEDEELGLIFSQLFLPNWHSCN
jgi:hypothetical protein